MSLTGWPIARRLDRVAVASRARSGLWLGGMSFPNKPESVPSVRRFVRIVTEAFEVAHIDEKAVLLVSELAGNAVTHAHHASRGCFDVVVRRKSDRLRIAVQDGSHELPVMRHSGMLDESGRGLLLVAELADAYGAYRLVRGKVVWFELIAWDEGPGR